MFRWWRQGPRSVDGWLAIATRGLCDDARERIGEEIASHYEDALSDARAKGVNEAGARAHAMRSLGTPRDARRRLIRQHLTRLESKLLDGMYDYHKSQRTLYENRASYAKSVAVIGVALLAPFLMIALVLGLIGFLDAGAQYQVTNGLKVLVIAAIVVAVGAWLLYGAIILHLPPRNLSAWRQVRRWGMLSAVWSCVCLLTTAYAIESEYRNWQERQEFRAFAAQYESQSEEAVPPPKRETFPLQFPALDILFNFVFFGTSVVAAWWCLRFAAKLRRLGYSGPPPSLV